jgi:hypothetical protein
MKKVLLQKVSLFSLIVVFTTGCATANTAISPAPMYNEKKQSTEQGGYKGSIVSTIESRLKIKPEAKVENQTKPSNEILYNGYNFFYKKNIGAY